MGGWSRLSLVGIVLVAALPLFFLVPALTESSPPPAAKPDNTALAALKKGVGERTKAQQVHVAPAGPVVVAPPVVAPVPVSIPNPSGPEVLALQQRLSSLGYLVGEIDGTLGGATKHGITAFQKVEGLERTGVADAATLSRLGNAVTPLPKFTTPPDHFEIDIPRQVVFVVRGGKVTAILPTSTGNNKLFTSQGSTRRAVTPNGQFQVYFKRQGWRNAPLGRLYRPAYFNGGIAFHGSTSIPTTPASHGCVRLPMAFADWFADNSPIGSVVYVHGGPTGENPQPLLDEPPSGISQQGRLPAGLDAAPVPVPVAPVSAPAPPADPVEGLLDGLLSPN